MYLDYLLALEVSRDPPEKKMMFEIEIVSDSKFNIAIIISFDIKLIENFS
jgi:hypothetical protein